ncbi:MAG: protein-L-isoaspartate(D-aspartate) O-methyltransferase [Candidatus Wallbacteria bacterium]|nr:protein-L-isoaspartate(D-aspartate) O-methyltransferase [Candidatus Wallbacteria bacterium]
MDSNQRLCRKLSGGGFSHSVIKALELTDRAMFVPPEQKHFAYEDRALPIGHGQTISQPSVVILMTDRLELTGSEEVLEIGTGSGYQAAILAKLCRNLVTVEIIPPLQQQAQALFTKLGLSNVVCLSGDAFLLADSTQYDRIIVTCALPVIPAELTGLLRPGGIMVAPVDAGIWHQELLKITRNRDKLLIEKIEDVVFVPMTGKIREKASA